MISFLEMAQKYPIGKKINVPMGRNENIKDNENQEETSLQKSREILGYEYYNGTGYLLFGDDEKMKIDG